MGKPKKDESDYFKNKKDTNQRPGESYNIIASLAAGIPSIVMGVDAYMKRNEARDNLKTQQGYVDTLMKQYMETPIYNPYENLSVATQANQIKMEETDKALANTLDTLRAQGASAGGATALAQAALKSKAGIAADIEKQEVMNERLKAQGEIMVQNAEMQRKGQQMDYEQSKADQSRMEQFAYGERAADMAGALGSLGLQVARGLGDGKSETTTDTPVAPPVNTEDQDFIRNYLYGDNQTGNKMSTNELTKPVDATASNTNPNNKPLGSGFDNTSFDFDAEMAKFNDPSTWGRIDQMSKRYRELESGGFTKEAEQIYEALNAFKLEKGLKPGVLVQKGKYNFQ